MNDQQRIRKLERKLKKEQQLCNQLAEELALLPTDPTIQLFCNTHFAQQTLNQWKQQRCF